MQVPVRAEGEKVKDNSVLSLAGCQLALQAHFHISGNNNVWDHLSSWISIEDHHLAEPA